MNRFRIFVALALAVLLGVSSSADAAFRLRVESGTTTGPGVVITDEAASESGSAGIFAGTPNAIAFAGTVGQFTLNVTTGTSTPFLVVPGFYEAADLNNVTINSTGAGTLRIILARSDYGSLTPDGPLEFRNDVGGVLAAGSGSTITFKTYADDANAIPDLGVDVNPVGVLDLVSGIGAGSPAVITQSFGTGAFSGSKGTDFSKTGTYSLYTVVEVNFTSGGSVSFDHMYGTAPAPAGLVLLVSGAPVFALGVWLRRRKVKTDNS